MQRRSGQDDEPSMDYQVEGYSNTFDVYVHVNRVNHEPVSSAMPTAVVDWPEATISKNKHVDCLLVLVR